MLLMRQLPKMAEHSKSDFPGERFSFDEMKNSWAPCVHSTPAKAKPRVFIDTYSRRRLVTMTLQNHLCAHLLAITEAIIIIAALHFSSSSVLFTAKPNIGLL